MDICTLIQSADYEHCRKVSEISGKVAEYMGFSKDESKLTGQAALFHDVGKSRIPRELLDKPGALTAPEYEIVKQHAHLGGEMILDIIKVLTAAYKLAVNHHERLDGSGYRGLTADEIPVRERIVAAVDVFDALLAKRPYKRPWALPDVLSYFDRRAGREFDRDVVAVLTERADSLAALYR